MTTPTISYHPESDYSHWPQALLEQDFCKYANILRTCTRLNRIHSAGIDLSTFHARFAAVEAELHRRLADTPYDIREQIDGTLTIKI